MSIKRDDDLDGLLQQQVCIILGNNYVLTFLEKKQISLMKSTPH